MELRHTLQLLEETRDRCRLLEESLTDARSRLDRAEQERGELRRLLAATITTPQLAAPLPSQSEGKQPWWRRWFG